MSLRAVLQQRKSKDQPCGPDAQQPNHRKRAKVSEDRLAAGLRFDVARQLCPRPPGIAIKPAADAELPLYSAREHRSFEGSSSTARTRATPTAMANACMKIRWSSGNVNRNEGASVQRYVGTNRIRPVAGRSGTRNFFLWPEQPNSRSAAI